MPSERKGEEGKKKKQLKFGKKPRKMAEEKEKSELGERITKEKCTKQTNKHGQ